MKRLVDFVTSINKTYNGEYDLYIVTDGVDTGKYYVINKNALTDSNYVAVLAHGTTTECYRQLCETCL